MKVNVYPVVMGLIEAAAWGLAGGAAAGLLALSAEVTAKGWPSKQERWIRVFAAAVGLVLGALVAGANHAQLAGAWPALIMGASAPSVLRGALSRLEVSERPVAARRGSRHTTGIVPADQDRASPLPALATQRLPE